jgi:predicted PurR-regulated permease PerM
MFKPMTNPVPVSKTPWVFNLASVVIVISALYFARALLMPIALAVLFSFALSPVCRALESLRLGRIPAVLTTAFTGFALFCVFIGLAAVELASIWSMIPEYQRNLEGKFRSVNRYTEQFLSAATDALGVLSDRVSATGHLATPHGTIESPFAVRIVTSPISPLKVLEGVYGPLTEILGTSAVVIVLVIFFLVRREDLRDRFVYLAGRDRVTLTSETMEDVAARVSSYLSTLFLINLAFGVSVGIGLWLIGVPSAALWGILAMTLRFIPYFGPWISAAMPIGISFAISTDWMAPLFTILLFIILELINNNVIEPWIYGKNTGVSAVAVLVAAFFWMWLWGPIGLLLATPLTVCVLVVGKHVPELSFLDILLGTEPVFEMKERIYQRLLAGDQDKAVELFEECVQETSIVNAYDTLLLPALTRAEVHWQLGDLKEEKHKFILQSLKDIVQYRSERSREIEAKGLSENECAPVRTVSDAKCEKIESCGTDEVIAGDKRRPEPVIFCFPARTEADEVSALMLSQMLAEEGLMAQAFPVSTSALEVVELASQSRYALICIAAAPPTAIMHSRSLVRRLYDQVPNMPLIVGLWDGERDLRQAKERIGCKAIVVGSMADAMSCIRSLISTPEVAERHPKE